MIHDSSYTKKLLIFLIVFFGVLVPSYSLATTYWVSPTGAAANLAACSGATPLSGTSACNYARANGLGVVAGDTVYYRTGTYSGITGSFISPYNSGTSGSRITFATYSNEVVTVVGANNNTGWAIVLSNKNWIKVTGYDGSTAARNFKFSNFFVNLWVYDGSSGSYVGPGSNYNEVSYCDFGAYTTAAFNLDVYRGSTMFHSSTYNWVHHNTFHDCGGQPPTQYDVCSPLEIGWDDNPANSGDNTNYNVIENNKIYHGGHNALGVHAKYNVIRNNIVHNEQWYQATGNTKCTASATPWPCCTGSGTGTCAQDNLWYAHAGLSTEGMYGNAGFSLYEGNSFSHAALKWGSSGGGSINKLGNSWNIFRYNSLYANGAAALYIENHTQATTGHSKHNHIYNNTFFANGYGALFPDANYPPDAGQPGGSPGKPYTNPPDKGPIYIVGDDYGTNVFASEAGLYGTVIKNNLFYKNLGTEIAYSHRYNHSWGFSGCSGQSVCGDTEITNNYTDANGDPKFVSEGDYGSPSILNANKDWYWGTSNPDGSDITVFKVQPTFTLQSGSPAIDGGTYLTQANGAGSNSTTLVVNDAYYFQPGWGNGAGGGASVAADWIAIGTRTNVVQISSINYYTNTITLASLMTWADNANIWLYKKSDGAQVLYGSAPDFGAYEYIGAAPSPDTTPPSAPTGVTVI